jgi:hypothetical protein
MVNNKTNEWVQFRVGKLRRFSNDCVQLDRVSHVSHINNALNIFETGNINAGLVFDRSKLNTQRILVVWLSPNDWTGAGGFRYGNVRFNFDWKQLIEGRNYYWIESIAYGIPACRILVTSNDYSSIFPIYEPTRGDGPWWHKADTDTHYFNGVYCLEIMIERDVLIKEASTIDFVDHSPNKCNISPNGCPDRELHRSRAGARFIAALIAREYDLNINNLFKYRPNIIEENILTSSISILWQDMNSGVFVGDIKATDDIALTMSRAVLNSYANGNYEEMDQLCSLFKSKDDLKNSCAQLIGKGLNIPDWTILIDSLRRTYTS